MNVTVRNVQEIKAMSEETVCFHATVLIDGKVVGTAENDGKGGANRYQPWSLKDVLDAYAKTLPKVEVHGESFEQDADVAIGDLVQSFQMAKAFRKDVGKRVMFINDKGKLMQTKVLPKGVDVMETARKFQSRPDVVHVLNLLPEAEGLALFTKTLEG